MALEEETICLNTEDKIWLTVEKICRRLEDLGTEVAVLSCNPKREVYDCKATHYGNVFLENNPDWIQRFKDFCVEKYISEKSTVNVIKDCVAPNGTTTKSQSEQRTPDGSAEIIQSENRTPKNIAENNQSDEDTEGYSDYETSCGNKQIRGVRRKSETVTNSGKLCSMQKNQTISKKRSKLKAKENVGNQKIKKQVVSTAQRSFIKTRNAVTANTRSSRSSRLKRSCIATKGESPVSNKSSAATREMSFQNKKKSISENELKMSTGNDLEVSNENDLEISNEDDLKLRGVGSENKLKLSNENEHNLKKTCPICHTEWNGLISYVNHFRVHKDYQLCPMCDEVILINEVTMAIHIEQNHSGANPFKCKACGRGYKSKNGLKNHFESIHADSSTRRWCELCKRGFGSKNSFTNHMNSHKKGRKCFICVKIFKNLDLLKEHMRDSHGNYLCLVCGSYFPGLFELQGHEITHTEKERENPQMNVDIRDFDKSDSQNFDENKSLQKKPDSFENSSRISESHDQNFSNSIELEKCTESIELNNSNEKIENIDIQKGNARKQFKCKFCGRIFKVAIYFIRHIRLHNNQSEFTCHHCGKVCKSEDTFRHHIALHLPDDKKPHQCELCGKGFVTRTALRKHSIVHTKAKDYICEFCGKGCRDSTKLQIHRRSHTGERPYKCKSCGKSYRSWDSLKNHNLQAHLPKRSFMCDICGKIYTTKHRLEEHKHTHREEGLKCDVCGLQTLSVRGLRRHLVLEHLEIAKERGYKIFTCEYCTKILPDKEKYDYHIRIHTGARPFSCTECAKSFRDKKQLKMHKRTHSNEKRYKCTLCDKLFQYNRTLKKHLLSHDTDSTNQSFSQLSYNNNTSRPYRKNLVSHDVDSANQISSESTYHETAANVGEVFNPVSHTVQHEQQSYSLHSLNEVDRAHESIGAVSEKSHGTLVDRSEKSANIIQSIHNMSGSHGYPTCMGFYAEPSRSQTYVSEEQLHQQSSHTSCTYTNLYPRHNLGEPH